ncbi:MAG: hypothetical protein LCH30_11160 [Proteobacteria bacterium]|nr:hypothetical protein [Pseudomonadota bacterium]
MFQKFEPQFVDVPKLAQNCFFYCLALHYSVNNIELPEELFQDYPGDSDSYLQLKALIREDGLDFFEKYVDEKYKPSDFVFEKNLLLGFLFRSLYVHKLSNNEVMKKSIISGESQDTLMKLVKRKVDVYSENDTFEDNFLSAEDAAIYIDNRPYFIALRNNDKLPEIAKEYREGEQKQKLDSLIRAFKLQLENLLNVERLHNEDKCKSLYKANIAFFETIITKEDFAEKGFAEKEFAKEYLNYCNYLLGEAYISRDEISFFLDGLGIKFGFFDEKSAENKPPFILKIVKDDDHYILLKQNGSLIFENYEKQLKEYKTQSTTDLLFSSVTTDDSTPDRAATPPLDRLLNCLKNIKDSYAKKQTESQSQGSFPDELMQPLEPIKPFEVPLVDGVGELNALSVRDSVVVETREANERAEIVDSPRVVNPKQVNEASNGSIDNSPQDSLLKIALNNLDLVAQKNLNSNQVTALREIAKKYEKNVLDYINKKLTALEPITKQFLKEANDIFKINNKAGKVVAAVALAVVAFVLTAALVATLCFITGGLAGFWALSFAAVGLVVKSGLAVGVIASISASASAIAGVASGAALANKLGFFEANAVSNAVDKVAEEAASQVLAAG